jgi:transposase
MGRYATKFATVTQDDREWLRGQWKNGETHTTRCRAHAIILSSQHLSTVEISLILAVTYETVSSWLDRWEELGRDGILDADRPGRPPILDQKDLDAVRKIVQEHPQEPSVILNEALKETDKAFSRSTLRRAIKKMGFRWKRLRLSLKKQRDSKAFQKASQHLKALIESDEVNVVYLDEAHFSASGVVSYAWQQKGERLLIPISGRTRKGIQVIGFQSSKGRVRTYVQRSNVCGKTIVAAINDYLKTIRRKTVLVLDNASPHTCNEVKSHLGDWSQKGLILYRLPPYCPELNAIEHLWNKLKHQILPRTAWESIEALGKCLLESLKRLGVVREFESMPSL